MFARRGPFLYRDVDERLAPALIGRDPLAITDALRAMEAVRLVERIMDFDPEMLEQPVPARALHAMAEIRRSVSLPIMADESIGPPRDAMEVIRREAEG